MSDLVEFLRARLDEDEAAAQGAANGSGRWRWDHGQGDLCNDPTCPYGELVAEGESDDADIVLMDVHGYDVNEAWEGAAHIARHDPARVLREVAAKRRIVKEHEPVPKDSIAVSGDEGFGCTTCHHSSDEGVMGFGLCATIRLLALPYAEHELYREEWRP